MLRVTIFDVGQASSALIDFGSGRLGIIDCGVGLTDRNPLAEVVKARLWADEESYVSFILLSHLDWDHISGISELLEDEKIRKRIRRICCNKEDFNALLGLVRATIKGGSGVTENPISRRRIAALGLINSFIGRPPRRSTDFHRELISPESSDPSRYPVRLMFDDLSEFSLFLLSPSQRLRDRSSKLIGRLFSSSAEALDILGSLAEKSIDWNAASAVVAVEYSGRRVLFCGDANVYTWREIAARSTQAALSLCSDITIAWHHGAKLGVYSGEDFDDTVWNNLLGGESAKEKFVIASHGCGRYGHPHEKTVSNITSRGACLLCTELRASDSSTGGEHLTAFEHLGLIAEFGDTEEMKIYKLDICRCSGDINVDIDMAGDILIDCSGPRKPSTPPLPTCCLAQVTEDQKPSGGGS